MAETEKVYGFCPTCKKEVKTFTKSELERKLKPSKSRSRKTKGMECQKLVAEKIAAAFGLSQDDVLSTGSGRTGVDIRLSEKAKECFGFVAIEVTASRSETSNPLVKFRQAVAHSEKQKIKLGGEVWKPILIYKRDNTPFYALVLFDDLLEVLSEKGVPS